MAESTKHHELLALTAQIVAAYVSNNTLQEAEIPALIEQVFKSLATVNIAAESRTDRPPPAVPIKKSVTPDYIICLEDGKKLKMLRRHLKTAYNMTPQDYRERWGLPSDYPMVAPNYAARRSNLAKDIGLGKKAGSKR